MSGQGDLIVEDLAGAAKAGEAVATSPTAMAGATRNRMRTSMAAQRTGERLTVIGLTSGAYTASRVIPRYAMILVAVAS